MTRRGRSRPATSRRPRRRRLLELEGLLLDLDGTLLESNDLHVRAWREVLDEAGVGVPARRIRPLIGMGGEDLARALLPSRTAASDLRALAETDPALKDAVDELIQRSGITEVPIEVWIDHDNFVRRMKQTLEGATAGSGVKMDLTTTTELYDFGTDVNVEEPPASQVVDLQDVLGQS